ncbi:MAG: 16S rRNA (adenine(1518)-N(6)/adenine(1519)-N(6))-dimethyltransferase RsmA [Alphaproteobacteria bacterium]|nr:16S rRNA (adenine(1518)-N(6)/adenine(1519)-N(6))-dimethyltransferase RsmA [Alphaproteobacteria bacterium]
MGRLEALPPLGEVIRRHELAPVRALGQNFLLDLNLTGKIARSAGDLGQGTTIEIGPGPGGLTRALLMAGAAKVVAIERDRRCLPALAEIAEAAEGRLAVVEGDALAIDATRLGDPPRRIVANLPYNVATPLLFAWLARLGDFESLTLMFQKEVAERITARPSTKAYGRLAVMTQWVGEAKRLFDIPGRAFIPPPKVTSSVVRITPRAAPQGEADPEVFARVVAAAFGQRRKMLRQALKPLGDAEGLLARAGIDPTRRAETLEPAEFARLARALTGPAGGA